MGNRIDNVFRSNEIGKRKTLIVNMAGAGGEPESLLPVLEQAGADIACAALPGDGLFDRLASLRARTLLPLILVVPADATLQSGVMSFFRRCAGAGADGVYLPDIPLAESYAAAYAAREAGMRFVRSVSDDSAGDFDRIVREAEGFLLCSPAPGKEPVALLHAVKRLKRVPAALRLGGNMLSQVIEQKQLVEAVWLDFALPTSGLWEKDVQSIVHTVKLFREALDA